MKEISNAAIPAEMNYRALLVVFQWLDLFLFCFFFPKLQKLYIEPTLLVKFKLLGLVLLASFLLVHASVFLVIFLEGISCKESITI